MSMSETLRRLLSSSTTGTTTGTTPGGTPAVPAARR
jgi:hypothetical protein